MREAAIMSLFGEHLRTLVEVNKINIYALAKQAGLERTAIHKIMSGNRIPTEDYMQKLADALPLSPKERERFLESYKISSIGEFKYKQRIQVKELIESIAQIEKDIGARKKNSGTTPAPAGDTNTVAIGSFEVNNLVRSAITEALNNEKKRTVDFVVSDDYQFFYNELISEYIQNPQAQVRQIVTLLKKSDFIDNSNVNLRLLSKILPLAFVSGTGYDPHYIYRTTPDIDPAQAMPYFILISSQKLVLINKDFSRAALINDRCIVDMYSESFEIMFEQSRPLINNFDSAFEILEYCFSMYQQSNDEPFHWIEPEPCVGSSFSEDLIDKTLKSDIPNREEFIKLLYRHYSFIRENQQQNINVCTTEGTLRLIDNGMMYYAPKELFNTMPRHTMRDILVKLQERMENNNVKVLFTNPSKIILPGNTLLTISRRTGINFIMSIDGGSNLSIFMCINISEDSINNAFADFVESIEESGLVYSKEESADTLAKIVSEID